MIIQNNKGKIDENYKIWTCICTCIFKGNMYSMYIHKIIKKWKNICEL